MSLLIVVNKCRVCGKEVVVNEAGCYKNPDGTITVNRRVYTVNERHCPFCRSKEAGNEE